ncbi:hypothetical protein GB928_003830 [Shinella curvata]|uniref:HpcH/HpaI aldolase/citrate lyase domain-containing protein n=1 Tax=Shinella curvata TaxID=1817964 RepID=A0ABT8XAL5_9HYPH|nr:hypothetical protein [Shinella curvata]MCJ8051746.1 hypothetical protein [Shinella curvata]MDO6120306.1 hypothetical protein [Shinella curvata]
MTPLPRALLALAPDQPIPADRRGVLIPIERIAETNIDGAIVVVEIHSDIATLQKALVAGAATIALDGCRIGADLQRFATLLSVAEAQADRPEGSTPILAFTDGILPAPAARESLAGKSQRLAGLVWDQRALAAALGATRTSTDFDDCAPPFAAARAATLLTAAAAGVPAFDSAIELEEEALERALKRSRTEGFFGHVAIPRPQTEATEAN